MSEQPDLFDVGERKRLHVKGTPCTAAPIGSGPEGETCRTCKHRTQVKYAGTYQKCGLMEHAWTGGGATDIKVYWAACREWQPAERRQ